MKYTMTTPCSLCPFRNDQKRLTVPAARLADFTIGEFPCHQTAESKEDEEGFSEFVATEDSQHCAGALIMLEKMEAPHQMMRIAERLGLYDRTKLDMDAPVFGDFAEVRAADRNKRGKTKSKKARASKES
jgi:hypothetical protein